MHPNLVSETQSKHVKTINQHSTPQITIF